MLEQTAHDTLTFVCGEQTAPLLFTLPPPLFTHVCGLWLIHVC